MRVTWAIVSLCAVAACSNEDGGRPDGFETAAVPPSTTGSTGAVGASSSSGAGDSSSETSTGTTGSPTTSSSTGAAETGEPDPGTQPAEGLYADCISDDQCGPSPGLCFTFTDMDGNTTDGFCSRSECTNAAVDCVPTPGATALPACVPRTVNDMPNSACALDCSGGATCPSGMTCQALDFGSICG